MFKKFFARQAALTSQLITDSIATPVTDPALFPPTSANCYTPEERHPRSATDSAYGVDTFVRIDFLSELPYEIAVHILTFLPNVASLSRVRYVSQRWYTLANDNEVWKQMFFERWGSCLNKGRLSEMRSREHATSSSGVNGGVDSSGQQLQQQQRLYLAVDWKHLYRQREKLHVNWRASTEEIEKHTFVGHEDSVYCIQFDNNKIVSGSRDRTVKFWDLETRQITRELRGHEGSVLCLQYDHRYVVTGSSDTTIRIWSMETGKCIRILYGHSQPVLDVRFNEKVIVSCSKDYTIKVWDIATGQLVRTMEGHTAAINAVHLHGSVVASASGDGDVRLWDVYTGKCIQVLAGHSRGLACVQFDGKTVVSGSNDRTIRIWDAATGTCLRELTGHADLVRTLCFDSKHIVSGSYDQTIRVWDMETGECLGVHANVHDSWVFHVQIDAGKMVSASQDKKIIVWDFTSGVPEATAFL